MKNEQIKTHPMFFNSDMVSALLEGRKTETRRKIDSPNQKIKFKTGDIIYIRESIMLHKDTHDFKYFSDLTVKEFTKLVSLGYKRIPSIHMKKQHARVFLRINSVRKQKLMEITRESAISEGIESYYKKTDGGRIVEYKNYILKGVMGKFINPIHSFKSLWISIYGAQDWNDNPWVLVINFKMIEKPEAWN